jgi:hypothetical protein
MLDRLEFKACKEILEHLVHLVYRDRKVCRVRLAV